MPKNKNFIEREVFEELIAQVSTDQGGQYEDTDTIYGDLSRLVVAIVANTPPKDLQATYGKLGWKGSANVKAIHKVAEQWYTLYHPDRLH